MVDESIEHVVVGADLDARHIPGPEPVFVDQLAHNGHGRVGE